MAKKIVMNRRFAEPTQIDKNTPGLTRERWLEDVAVGFRDNNLVLEGILPTKDVVYDSAKYRVYSPKGYFKAATKRGETALPEQAALQYSSDTYTCEEYALEGWVSDDSIRNVRGPQGAIGVDPMMDETEFLTQKIALTQELLIATEILSAVKAAGATHYTNLGALTNWLTGTSADILGNLSTAIKAIVNRTGQRPNSLYMNTDTIEAVINNTTVIDILKRMSSGVLTEAVPVSRLRGMTVDIADGIVNTGDQETPVYKSVLYDVDTATPLNQYVVIAFVSPASKLTAGRTFVSKQFRVFTGRGLEGGRRQATLVAVWKKLVPKVCNVGALHLIGSVLG